MSDIERTLRAIEAVRAGRDGDGKEIAAGSGEEGKSALQEREAIHLCLTSAATLLVVVQQLMTEPAAPSSGARALRLSRLVADIRTGGRTAYQAGLVLLGQDTCLAQQPIETSQDQGRKCTRG